MITLTRNDSLETITLPPDMRWLDEFDWQSLAQSEPVYSLGGEVIIQQGIKRNGRPITLGGDWVWLTKDTLLTLQTWADTAGLTLTLDYHTKRFAVIFARTALSNIEPVAFMATEQGEAFYQGVSIHLMTV